jgi:hypothetical protein
MKINSNSIIWVHTITGSKYLEKVVVFGLSHFLLIRVSLLVMELYGLKEDLELKQ